MEFKELLAAFAAKYGVEGFDGADGAAELDVDGVRVELLDDPQSQSLFACAEIGHPPPDANGAFGAMMLQANFLLRGTEGATLCQNPETQAYKPTRSCVRSPWRWRTSSRSQRASSRSSTRRRTGARRSPACVRRKPRKSKAWRPGQTATPTTTCFQAAIFMCNLFTSCVYTTCNND